MTHAELVSKLVKPGYEIIRTLSDNDANLIHMVLGISGEAGELLDAIKKCTIYNRPLDRKNVIEELGDLDFYMEGLRQALEITREECLKANIEKLSKRYPGIRYTDEAAKERLDKKTDVEKACDEARERVGAMSQKQRAELFKRSMNAINKHKAKAKKRKDKQ